MPNLSTTPAALAVRRRFGAEYVGRKHRPANGRRLPRGRRCRGRRAGVGRMRRRESCLDAVGAAKSEEVGPLRGAMGTRDVAVLVGLGCPCGAFAIVALVGYLS